MKKSMVLVLVWLLIGMLQTSSSARAQSGVDDLRGRWDIEAVFYDAADPTPVSFILYINDLEENPVDPTIFIAAGCMRSLDTDEVLPLSMMAFFDPELNNYELIVFSTVSTSDGERFVIRFNGIVDIYGSGVTDDVPGGEFKTEHSGSDWAGSWTGIHHDRRQTKCPSIANNGQLFQGDVYAHQDLAFTPPRYSTLLEGFTVIVSSGMVVETPDGSEHHIPFYTDIFTPDIDFVGRFRYLEGIENSAPISGQPYHFYLLDILGKPIPGSESSDTWTLCQPEAPTNLQAVYSPEANIAVSWDGVGTYPGEFDMSAEIGFYQFGLSPQLGSSTNYGASGMLTTSHQIPWIFHPGDDGTPDGSDFGDSLSALDDDLYELAVEAYFQSNPAGGGKYHECGSKDSSQSLFIEKVGEEYNIFHPGSISGTVTDSDGNPVQALWVDACEFDSEQPLCRSAFTNEFGSYRITGLIPGDYRVSIWNQPGWANQFYYDTPAWHEAARLAVLPGDTIAGIDFSLQQGGGISGTVYDADGNSLGGIGVDVEGGGYGTCTDENGQYTLTGIPFGSYTVLAGHQFCGQHPFEFQQVDSITIDEFSPDIWGVDFYLALAVDPPSQFLNVQPDHGWADSGGWTVGSDVTLSFPPSFTATMKAFAPDGDPEFGMVNFSFDPSILGPGTIVTITDGTDTKELEIVNITFDFVDETEHTAGGTGPAGAWLAVGINAVDGHFWVDQIQIDEGGIWSVDFDDYGQPFGVVLDAWVHAFDDDNDSTIAHLTIEPPSGSVSGTVLYGGDPGQPLANVEVFLGILGEPFEARYVCTDAQGYFTFTDVPVDIPLISATGRSVSEQNCMNAAFVAPAGLPLLTGWWQSFSLSSEFPDYVGEFSISSASHIQQVSVSLDGSPMDGLMVRAVDYILAGQPEPEAYAGAYDNDEVLIIQEPVGVYGTPGEVELRYAGIPASMLILISYVDGLGGSQTFGILVEAADFPEVNGVYVLPPVEFCFVTSGSTIEMGDCAGGSASIVPLEMGHLRKDSILLV